MKTKVFMKMIKIGIALFLFVIISFNSFSQSCHGGGSNNESNKSIVKTTTYKKSTKKKYFVCKKHPNIKNNSKGFCSICNSKLKKKFEYFYD